VGDKNVAVHIDGDAVSLLVVERQLQITRACIIELTSWAASCTSMGLLRALSMNSNACQPSPHPVPHGSMSPISLEALGFFANTWVLYNLAFFYS
jgi:hypothetical protein